MTFRMTKKQIKRYEKKLQEEATRQDPKRNRKLVRVLFILSTNWAQHTALFTEEVKIIDKKLFEKSAIIFIDYGKVDYGYIDNEYNGVVSVDCKIEDFDKYNIGDKIIVYVYWSKGYDGTLIRLNLYDCWENHIPRIEYL